ncbi:thiaminase II [Xanthocytophaga flava]|uniref:thiaminase II n=1 Tax=Xanthocytophaga flava TaxID=3048013 RepID=UPI0028D890C9|nr:thiaminase II [Xanthocytophaga flavus]MDJ1472922.1 thiaminase II [Xanthocytophaga flavus]
MSTFSESLWNNNLDIYNFIINDDFIRELSDGFLPEEKFRYYIQQDALYLADFGKALALLAVKATDQSHMLQFLQFAQGAVIVEKALHENYFRLYNITGAPEKMPGCFAYTHFLVSTTAIQPLEVGVAAVLPCFWIYREVGKYILKHAATPNPYQQWIDTYAGDEFDTLVTQMLEITNTLAAQTTDSLRAQMQEVFRFSCRMEWTFWNDAYVLNAWKPV